MAAPDDGTGGDTGDEAFVFALLQRFTADLAAGGLRPLAEYQAGHPGRQAEVAREYAALLPDAAAAPSTALGPRRIQRFVVERELGRGGQAVVWLATDPKLQRQVALKVLERGFATVEQELRLEREAATAARLDDPGICAVHEVGRDGEHVFVVMRLVPGRTLAAHLDLVRQQVAAGRATLASGWPWQQVVTCFERAARSLERAHAAGVVHRDLKPGNIMIEPDGTPVLLDFGLAAPTDRDSDMMTLSRTGDLSGTPSYLPPERLLGQGGRDVSGDLWSLGVSLYEALLLQRPFSAPTVAALYQQILVAEPTPLRQVRRDLPRDLEVVLRVVLDKDPQRRYRSAEALAADLRAVLRREPIAARPPSAGRRFVLAHRRHPALATLAWGGLLATLGVVAVQARALAAIAAARDEATGINDFLV
jgi:serine/threonine protein kinase